MPATKPTTLAGATRQTGHAKNASLVYACPFLDGAGNTVTDIISGNNGTASISGEGGGWNTSVVPYSFLMAENPSVNTYILNSNFTYSTGTSYTHVIRFRCDVIDATASRPAAIFSGVNFADSTPSNTCGVFVYPDNTIEVMMGNNNGTRTVSGIPYVVGTDGWVIIHMVYDYATGLVTAYKDGVSYAQTATSGDKPGSFGSAPANPMNYGRSQQASEDNQHGWDGELDVHYIHTEAFSQTDVDADIADIYARIAAGGGGGGGGSILPIIQHYRNQD